MEIQLKSERNYRYTENIKDYFLIVLTLFKRLLKAKSGNINIEFISYQLKHMKTIAQKREQLEIHNVKILTLKKTDKVLILSML